MNEIVTKLKAADLPERVRLGINPEHEVEVIVRDLGVPRRRLTTDELRRMLEDHVREHGDPNGTMEDAVRRVNALREEWD